MARTVGFVLISIILATYLLTNILKLESIDSILSVVLYSLFFFSGVGLWIWMFSHLMKNDRINNKVLWGWMFIILNIITAIFYFVFVYNTQGQDKKGN